METVTLSFRSEQFAKLTQIATNRGLDVPNLLLRLAEETIDRNARFDRATDYLMKKNDELYRRLTR